MILNTLLSFSLPLLVLFAGGLTALLWLLPRQYLCYGFFIAPAVGLTVFVSLGLFEIGVLLIPLRPISLSALIGLAFVTNAWFRRSELAVIIKGIKTHRTFLVTPAALLIIIAIGTQNFGLSFLSAGQDEIQYVNNSLHILQNQHTGNQADIRQRGCFMPNRDVAFIGDLLPVENSDDCRRDTRNEHLSDNRPDKGNGHHTHRRWNV